MSRAGAPASWAVNTSGARTGLAEDGLYGPSAHARRPRGSVIQ